jgi:hypothetical protein
MSGAAMPSQWGAAVWRPLPLASSTPPVDRGSQERVGSEGATLPLRNERRGGGGEEMWEGGCLSERVCRIASLSRL